MKTLIIQTSPKHTASTFLVNAIYGMIPELFDKKIIVSWMPNFQNYFNDIIVVKSHNTNIDELILEYSEKYNLIFICSERKQKNKFIDEKYKSYDNVIIFDFDELNETENYKLEDIVKNIYEKIKTPLKNIKLDTKKCFERLTLMNIRYEEIKYFDFNYIDNFFEIHGSHKNREY